MVILNEDAMAKTLPISEVKARLPELVAGVMEREEEVVVTRNGRPAAVLVNVGEYERLKGTLDVLSDPDLMRQIRAAERYFARGGKGVSFEDVFGEPLRRTKKRTR
jgi:prevent-host-death family protein